MCDVISNLVVGNGDVVVEVERVRQRLQEDVSGSDQNVFRRLPERILIFGYLCDVILTVQPLLVQVLNNEYSNGDFGESRIAKSKETCKVCYT